MDAPDGGADCHLCGKRPNRSTVETDADCNGLGGLGARCADDGRISREAFAYSEVRQDSCVLRVSPRLASHIGHSEPAWPHKRSNTVLCKPGWLPKTQTARYGQDGSLFFVDRAGWGSGSGIG